MALLNRLCPAFLTTPTLQNFNLNILRGMSGRRDKLYGSEEGHGLKNEVKKEKWIRKRYRKSLGREWREVNHYEPDTLTQGSLSRLPDWSFAASGSPGAPTPKQVLQRKESTELAKAIYEAAMLVHKANSMKTQKEF